jgi:hypothetical protein
MRFNRHLKTATRILCLLALLSLPNALAARAYFDGTYQAVYTTCPVTGNVAWRMRSLRVGLLALALALTLAACGGGGQNNTPLNKTYRIDLTALSAQGSPTVSGLPITGATITVQK